MPGSTAFDPGCRRCPRLAGYLDEVRAEHPDYHAAPVAPFGDPDARLLIVGLAPGFHGANRTGRPFTGDYAGVLLYETLHRFGLASAPTSTAADDGLTLSGSLITNALTCLTPDHKPVGAEIRLCNEFLVAELATLPAGAVCLALGKIAHDAVLRAHGLKLASLRFGHGAVHELSNGHTLVDSYHCSRYNTQTRRLTTDMFHEVVGRAAALAGVGSGW